MLGDGRVQHVAVLGTVPKTAATGLAIVRATGWKDGDRGGAHIMCAGRVAIVQTARVDSLNDELSVRCVIWSYDGNTIGCHDGWREGKRVEIGTFSDRGVLEDN